MKAIQPHDANWNPWTGCKKCSAACVNCTMFLQQTARYNNFNHDPKFDPTNIHRCTTTWRKPYQMQRKAVATGRDASLFVCGYSDFFIEEADAWRDDAWQVIRETPNVIYQISTKRTHRIADCLPADWGTGYKNVWFGASVELKRYFYRLDDLRAIPCVLRYADSLGMLESLMPELPDQLDGIGWCLSSGETGCGIVEPRAWVADWCREVRDVCEAKNIPFWFSHIAGKTTRHRLLDGKEYNEMPLLLEKK